jgi:kynureninase
MNAMPGRDHAEALDAADPLGSLRDRFLAGPANVVYLAGNSLGRPPARVLERVAAEIEGVWAGELVGGWEHWLDLPGVVGDLIGTSMLGARPGDTIVADSTSVNLYKLAWAGVAARPGRRTLISAAGEFPADRYVLEGIAAQFGLSLVEVDADSVAAAVDDDTALVCLSHVDYRTSAMAGMREISEAARSVGALSLWDLSHSAGVVQVDLDGDGADLAVGCTYKYLCAGPGAPAWLWVRRELQAELRQPIQGWFGQRDQFAMAPAYDPEPDIRRFRFLPRATISPRTTTDPYGSLPSDRAFRASSSATRMNFS